MSHLNLCLLFCLVALCASGSLNKEKSNELLCLYTGKFGDAIEWYYVGNKIKNETRLPDALIQFSPLQMDGFTKNQYPLQASFKNGITHNETHHIFVAELKNGEVVYYKYQMNSTYNSTSNTKTNGEVKEKIEINKYPIAWNFTDFSDGQFKGANSNCIWVNILPSGKVIFKKGCQPADYFTSEITKKEGAKFPPNWPCKK